MTVKKVRLEEIQGGLIMNRQGKEAGIMDIAASMESYQKALNAKVHDGGIASQGNNPGNEKIQMPVKKVRFKETNNKIVAKKKGTSVTTKEHSRPPKRMEKQLVDANKSF